MIKMQIKIINYEKKFDDELLGLFYKSTYHQKKEFEYFRFPPLWIRRYLDEEAIIKIAKINEKIVASVGLIIFNGRVNGEEQRIGFFVDNCILPELSSSYFEIFDKLFEEIENEAKNNRVNFIFGWDFVNRVEKHKKVFEKRGYAQVNGFYWYPTGSDLRISFGSKQENTLGFFWQILLGLGRINLTIKKRTNKEEKDIQIEKINKKDLAKVASFLNTHNHNVQFSLVYTENHLKKIFADKIAQGLLAKKGNEIEAVLLYFIGAWSGWMFGKPHYSKKHSFFFAYTPFEFVLRDEGRVKLATQMLFELITKEEEYTTKGGYSFFVDCFWEKERWRERALRDVGGEKAKFDFGCVLIKNLSNVKTNFNKIYLPSLFVIAPVPKDYKKHL